jgi:hypothetical protein
MAPEKGPFLFGVYFEFARWVTTFGITKVPNEVVFLNSSDLLQENSAEPVFSRQWFGTINYKWIAPSEPIGPGTSSKMALGRKSGSSLCETKIMAERLWTAKVFTN